MSKSKSQPKLSPENYIRTRARALPLAECYINELWNDCGMASIIVTRKHITGNLTFAMFQVDMYCLGVKDALWQFNEPPSAISDIIDRHTEFSGSKDPYVQIDYTSVHNIIYGAVSYAEDLGFRPHKDFTLAQYVLEEDDERIELMDIEFGLDGQPAIFIGHEEHPSRIFQILDKSVGKGNYTIISEDEDYEDEYEDEDDDEDDDENDFDDDDFDEPEAFDEEALPAVRPMTPDMVQFANEKLMKYIEEQNFSSIEDLNDFIAKNVMGKPIDEIVPKKKGRKSTKDKSGDLMSQAYDSDPEEGIRLAQQALQLDPENVRAYNYLAQNESNPEKSFILLKRAVELGEKQLGDQFFKVNKGHFWGLIETRPYMTAKFGMAQYLEAIGREKEAIKIYQEMLKLNPNDNQGVRYELARLLLINYRYDLFYKLHKKYKGEESAFWLYNYAYFVFKTHGTGKTSDEALNKAYMANKHVIGIIIGKEKMPDDLKEYYSPGQTDEAAFYLMDNIEMWMKDKETVRWVVNFRRKMD